METNQTPTNYPNKRLIDILLGGTLLLMIPLILQMTVGTGADGQGFNWQLNDYLAFGILVFSTGLLTEFVLRTIKRKHYRWLVCGVILVVSLLIWLDLAVGIFNFLGFSGD